MSNIIPINRNVFAFLIIILIIVNENASEENSTMNHKKIEELKKVFCISLPVCFIFCFFFNFMFYMIINLNSNNVKY